MALSRITAVAVGLSLALTGCETPHPELDPAFLKATAVEARVDVIERQNGAVLEVQRQLEAAQAEQRALKGQVEELQHAQASSERRDRDLYRDLSDRINSLEAKVRELNAAQAQAAASAPTAAVVPPAPVITDKDVYQSALEHLKAREYTVAEKAFQDFLVAYPQSSLADNAQYWLGEAYYVERRFTDALGAFQKLLKEHPDSRKVPDAMLKVGYSYQELKRYREARETLSRLIKTYPDAAATAEARDRLKQIPGRR